MYHQFRREEHFEVYTEEEKKTAWDETARVVKEYSDEMVKRWKEEIDTLLVYVRVPVPSLRHKQS